MAERPKDSCREFITKTLVSPRPLMNSSCSTWPRNTPPAPSIMALRSSLAAYWRPYTRNSQSTFLPRKELTARATTSLPLTGRVPPLTATTEHLLCLMQESCSNGSIPRWTYDTLPAISGNSFTRNLICNSELATTKSAVRRCHSTAAILRDE